MFTTIRYVTAGKGGGEGEGDAEGDEGVCVKCVFSPHACVTALQENQQCFDKSKLSSLLIEMYRLHGLYSIMEIRGLINQCYSTRRRMANKANLSDAYCKFVICPPNCDFASTETMLGITRTQFQQCKDEITRRRENLRQFDKQVHAAKQEMFKKDVGYFISVKKWCGMQSFEDMKKTFPGMAGVIEAGIYDCAQTEVCVFDAYTVASCLSHMDFMVNSVMSTDGHVNGDNMASFEAYDFMSGRSNGVLWDVLTCKQASTYCSLGAKSLYARRDEQGNDIQRKSTFTLKTLCAGLHLFDKLDENLKVCVDFRSEKAGLLCAQGTKLLDINMIDVGTRIADFAYYESVKKYVREVYQIEIPERPTVYPRITTKFLEDVTEFLNLTIKLLLARPRTKTFGLRYLGVYPETLCLFVNEVQNQDALRHLGIATPYD